MSGVDRTSKSADVWNDATDLKNRIVESEFPLIDLELCIEAIKAIAHEDAAVDDNMRQGILVYLACSASGHAKQVRERLWPHEDKQAG